MAGCIFANDLIQLYEIFSKAGKDHMLTFGQDLLRSLPKSRRQYEEEINFEEFESMPILLKKDLRQPDLKTIRDARFRRANLQEIGYQEPFMIEILPNGKIDQPGGASDYDSDMDYDVDQVQNEGQVSEQQFEQEVP